MQKFIIGLLLITLSIQAAQSVTEGPTTYYGENIEDFNPAAITRLPSHGVAHLRNYDPLFSGIRGNVKFFQYDPDYTVVSAQVSGLEGNASHSLEVHQTGDSNGGCYYLGP